MNSVLDSLHILGVTICLVYWHHKLSVNMHHITQLTERIITMCVFLFLFQWRWSKDVQKYILNKSTTRLLEVINTCFVLINTLIKKKKSLDAVENATLNDIIHQRLSSYRSSAFLSEFALFPRISSDLVRLKNRETSSFNLSSFVMTIQLIFVKCSRHWRKQIGENWCLVNLHSTK